MAHTTNIISSNGSSIANTFRSPLCEEEWYHANTANKQLKRYKPGHFSIITSFAIDLIIRFVERSSSSVVVTSLTISI